MPRYYGSPGHGTVDLGGRPRPDGKGYWVLLSDGEVFAYGSATDLGSSAPAGLQRLRSCQRHLRHVGRWRLLGVLGGGRGATRSETPPNDGSMAGTHLNGAIVAGNGY